MRQYYIYAEEAPLNFADRFERAQNNMNDTASRNAPILDHGDASGSNLASENPRPALIPLHGCCNSGAFRLLNDRTYSLQYSLLNLCLGNPLCGVSSCFQSLGISFSTKYLTMSL